jgi:hypothetical protein
MKIDKNKKIMLEIYRRAFAASTPICDFDKLMSKAEINESGQKTIPFMDYELDNDIAQKIINTVLKEYKVPKHKHQMFFTAYWFGCSPKHKTI